MFYNSVSAEMLCSKFGNGDYNSSVIHLRHIVSCCYFGHLDSWLGLMPMLRHDIGFLWEIQYLFLGQFIFSLCLDKHTDCPRHSKQLPKAFLPTQSWPKIETAANTWHFDKLFSWIIMVLLNYVSQEDSGKEKFDSSKCLWNWWSDLGGRGECWSRAACMLCWKKNLMPQFFSMPPV